MSAVVQAPSAGHGRGSLTSTRNPYHSGLDPYARVHDICDAPVGSFVGGRGPSRYPNLSQLTSGLDSPNRKSLLSRATGCFMLFPAVSIRRGTPERLCALPCGSVSLSLSLSLSLKTTAFQQRSNSGGKGQALGNRWMGVWLRVFDIYEIHSNWFEVILCTHGSDRKRTPPNAVWDCCEIKSLISTIFKDLSNTGVNLF